jgi:hypothetical protein
MGSNVLVLNVPPLRKRIDLRRFGFPHQDGPEVHEHKQRILSRSPRRLVPATVQERGTELYTKLLKVPGGNKAKDSGAAVLGATASGAGKFMTRTGQLTTSTSRVVRAYTKKGHPVGDLDDIRQLDLKHVFKVASFTRLHYAYSLTAAAEGAAAGLAVSGAKRRAAFRLTCPAAPP